MKSNEHEMDNVLSLWGKTISDGNYHPLLYHLIDTSITCRKLLDIYWQTLSVSKDWIVFFAGIHDIGKADFQFQSKVPIHINNVKSRLNLPFPDNSNSKRRHEVVSSYWLDNYLKSFKNINNHKVRLAIVGSIKGHHGRISPNWLDAYDCDCLDKAVFEKWDQTRNRISFLLKQALSLTLSPLDNFKISNLSDFGIKLTGLIVLSDWIASNEHLFGYKLSTVFNQTLEEYVCEANKKADIALKSLGFIPEYRKKFYGIFRFADLWPDLSNKRPIQDKIEEIVMKAELNPGLTIIEAPMGQGKTEAAIFLAEYLIALRELNGVYIALPTAATSNLMFDRYSEYINRIQGSKNQVFLVHGMSWLVDDSSVDLSETDQIQIDNEPMVRDWFFPKKRALLSPEAVGTIDQSLMAALNVKFGFLRLLGLSTKVLIIDEVHAYDSYMLTIIKRLLQWCNTMNIPVIMLSATLSQHQKVEMINAYTGKDNFYSHSNDYPQITVVNDNDTIKQLKVSTGENKTKISLKLQWGATEADDIAVQLVKLVENGGCASIIVNTVKSAQQIYFSLKKMKPDNLELYLFHARYKAGKRNEIEKEVVDLFGNKSDRRPKKSILVATQVVEQSLDVDFDVMMTELAPIDLILQRAGRMHRHNRKCRPTGSTPALYVLLPDKNDISVEKLCKVYDPLYLLRTVCLLENREQVVLPKDFRELIEGCYGSGNLHSKIVNTDELAKASEISIRSEGERKNNAKKHLIPEPKPNKFSMLSDDDLPVSEGDESQARDYFHAQTRIGDYTQSVLMIEDQSFNELLNQNKPPGKDKLKKIFLNKVSIPKWWLNGVDYEEIKGPKWIGGMPVLYTLNGVWNSETKTGNKVKIIDHPDSGIIFELEED